MKVIHLIPDDSDELVGGAEVRVYPSIAAALGASARELSNAAPEVLAASLRADERALDAAVDCAGIAVGTGAGDAWAVILDYDGERS